MHREQCKGVEGYKSINVLPKEGTILKFKNVKYEERVPFVIYADFECLTTSTVEEQHDSDSETEADAKDDKPPKPAPKGAYQQHEPISVGMKLISAVPGVLDTLPYETYTGADSAEWFLRRLLDYQRMCLEFLFDETRITMTPADHAAHTAATSCYICDEPFD